MLPVATTRRLIARLGLEPRSVYRASRLSPTRDPQEWFGWDRTTEVTASVHDAVVMSMYVSAGAGKQFGPDMQYPRPGVQRGVEGVKPSRVSDMKWGAQLGLV